MAKLVHARAPGLALAAGIALIAMAVGQMPWAARTGLSALPLAILAGIALGNTVFPRLAPCTGAGVDFAKQTLLRAGIVLYGVRVTFQDIAAVGWSGVLIDAIMIGLTFLLALQVGTRVLRLDRQTAMLIGAGSAICGAAAVLAAEPVVRAPAHKVSVAIATVVVFGTLGMLVYPLLYAHLGLTEHAYGVFTGSTVHEVAQVVAAGRAVSVGAASAALIEKMLRVMMLAPFLLLLSLGHPRTGSTRIRIPWFAVAFLAVIALHSMIALPAALTSALVWLDTLLLAMAMASLGLRTHAGAIRQAGARPLLLASVVFVFLVTGGYAVNRTVSALIG